MKIFFSLAVLAALAFVIRRLGFKKVEEIGKSIMQPSTHDEPASKAVETKTPVENKVSATEQAQTQSLELPLELEAILSAIKAKLHFSVDEDSNDTDEQDTNTDNDNNDYGTYGSYSNDGGSSGGGGGYFPYQPAVVTPVTATPVTTPVSASSIFSNILNVPKHAEVLPVKSFGNLSNILNGLGTTPQVTPTPSPTPNTPVISTAQTNNASNARTSNARTNNNHSYRHAGSARRRF